MDALDALREIVDRSGESGRGLAESMGRTSNYLHAIMYRGSKPRADTLAEVCAAAGCRLVVLDAATGEEVAEITAERRPPAGEEPPRGAGRGPRR